MKRALTALGTVLAMSSGCEPVTLEPLQTQAQARPVSDDASTAGEGFEALAMRAEEVPWPESGLLFSSTFLPADDPDALVLFFGSRALRCQTPVLEPDTITTTCLPSAGVWQAIVAIPSGLDRLGVVDLTNPRIGVFESMWSINGICGGGSMSLHGFQGTLEIVSSDATAIAVKLRSGPRDTWPAIDGDYTAHRCGAAPEPE